MKNLIYTLILGLLTNYSSFAQQTDEIFLKWKLDTNEILSYKTVLEQINSSDFEIDFGNFFNSLNDDNSKKAIEESKKFFKNLNEPFKNTKLTTVLSEEKDGIIEIKLIAKTEESNSDLEDNSKLLQKMLQQNSGVMLRGSVTENGAIHSFWLKTEQKNLIALLFELPNRTIKVGDIWNIDVNLIANDQNFICKEASKSNIVKLIDLKELKNETIAVIKYDIEEYVSGDYNMPSFSGESEVKKTTMKYNYQGIGEFSIDKGRWISYDAIFSLKQTGLINSDSKQKFSLINE